MVPPAHPKTPDLNGHVNSNGLSQAQQKQGEEFDPAYLSPKRSIRPGFNESRSGSEADSLLELYGHPRSVGERSVANSIEREREPPRDETYLDDEDPEHSRWIHRDKLAIIERHEMQKAGIELPPRPARSASKSKSRKEPSYNVPDLPSQETETLERKKRRTRSPVRQDDAGEETLVNDFDIRTPEEIAADQYMDSPSNIYRQPDLRKSSSRIPLPRSSPMPIPQEHIEREAPLPRKRGGSGTAEENGILYNRVRSRGNSVGSQALLDDPEPTPNTPTPNSRPVSRDSPTKSKVSNNRPVHSRKPSITNTTPNLQSRSRNPSIANSLRTPSFVQRPKSRSGLEPRPATAVNRPEGDPPWLASMYKPDPRLPPDQQILPTHAKRLDQEKSERERKGSAQQRLDDKAPAQLPREFSPLAEHTVNGLQPSSRDQDESTMQERPSPQKQSEWPLSVAPPPMGQQKPKPASPGLAVPDGSQHAGYSTMPRVKQNGSPVNSQVVGTSNNPKPLDPFEKEKMERAEKEKGGGGGGVTEKGKEEKVKEKGCGCCVVM